MLRDGDTIVALSSGAPPSGVAVIRLSGPGSGTVVTEILGTLPAPRRLKLADIVLGGETLDRGLIAWMPAPYSFTGEDCAELQVHGSPASVRAILRHITRFHDFRLAEAGEFTRRAFENGKLDLTEVEGLGDLIAAETEGQRRQALTRSAGGLTQRIDGWRERLLDARAEIEARLDFSDEGDVDAEIPASLIQDLDALQREFAEAGRSVASGRIVREGFRVALAGRPNAGKSSLLNALAKSEQAIVTAEAGTTRDIKEVPLDLGGQLVILVDMAGLRDTESLAEAEGVRRARLEIDAADLVLWLQPADQPEDNVNPADAWVIGTKSDLGETMGRAVSSRTGQGIAELMEAIRAAAEHRVGSAEAPLVSRERDRLALEAASGAVRQAIDDIGDEELAAEALRRASLALERLLGKMDAESVLDHLFAAFCIGK